MPQQKKAAQKRGHYEKKKSNPLPWIYPDRNSSLLSFGLWFIFFLHSGKWIQPLPKRRLPALPKTALLRQLAEKEAKTADEKITLTFWDENAGEKRTPYYEELIKRFNDSQDRIVVTYEGIPSSSAKEKYDVAMLPMPLLISATATLPGAPTGLPRNAW